MSLKTLMLLRGKIPWQPQPRRLERAQRFPKADLLPCLQPEVEVLRGLKDEHNSRAQVEFTQVLALAHGNALLVGMCYKAQVIVGTLAVSGTVCVQVLEARRKRLLSFVACPHPLPAQKNSRDTILGQRSITNCQSRYLLRPGWGGVCQTHSSLSINCARLAPAALITAKGEHARFSHPSHFCPSARPVFAFDHGPWQKQHIRSEVGALTSPAISREQEVRD